MVFYFFFSGVILRLCHLYLDEGGGGVFRQYVTCLIKFAIFCDDLNTKLMKVLGVIGR